MGTKSGTTTKKKIELSYVLPTFNRVEYLGECLLTLLEQDYDKDKYEVIVVDDGSNDSTHELIKYFLNNYKNISYYRNEHKGVEESRNFGNEKAKADIIGVCDSDDIYAPTRTELTIKYFKKHPNIDIMFGSYVEINHRGSEIKGYMAKRFTKKDFENNTFYFCHDNCAYKKSIILKTPYRIDGKGTDDYKLITDFVKNNYKFGYIKDELCKVRTLMHGIMGSRRAAMGVRLPHEG